MNFIGIDLGTSAVKLLLVDSTGKIINSVTEEYPLYFPKPGYSEQNPEDWFEKVMTGLEKLTENTDKSLIKGIGTAGQMHGLVMLDSDDNVIRPAILWNDGRSEKQVKYLNEDIGREKLTELTGNIAFAGFTAPKLLWVRENEPENFAKISKIMLPKDYIVYRLTGSFSTDYSDASGMLLLDVKNKKWSSEMLGSCGISEKQLPSLYESYETVGRLKEDIALKTGLNGVKVVAGAGDNAAAAIGTGCVGEGKCNISLGTSGTIFISSNAFCLDMNNSLHSFAHADGRYHLMGCMLSAASCNKWFTEDILGCCDYNGIQQGITDDMLGRNPVFFLPYLMGERSPWNDVNARGTFTGLTMSTKREDMLLAVLEGVAFAFRDMYEKAKETGVKPEFSYICGGGAKSSLWKKILSNVLGLELVTVKTEQGPGYGGAILAAVGTGGFADVDEACKKFTEIADTVVPNGELTALYEKRYSEFKKLYPALKDTFACLNSAE